MKTVKSKGDYILFKLAEANKEWFIGKFVGIDFHTNEYIIEYIDNDLSHNLVTTSFVEDITELKTNILLEVKVGDEDEKLAYFSHYEPKINKLCCFKYGRTSKTSTQIESVDIVKYKIFSHEITDKLVLVSDEKDFSESYKRYVVSGALANGGIKCFAEGTTYYTSNNLPTGVKLWKYFKEIE